MDLSKSINPARVEINIYFAVQFRSIHILTFRLYRYDSARLENLTSKYFKKYNVRNTFNTFDNINPYV